MSPVSFGEKGFIESTQTKVIEFRICLISEIHDLSISFSKSDSGMYDSIYLANLV